MAQGKVSHTSASALAIALLFTITHASVLSPFGFSPYFGGGGGFGGYPGGLQVGQRYSCGGSYSQCSYGHEEVSMKYAKDPSLLSGVTRTFEHYSNTLEGMLVSITDDSYGAQTSGDVHGPGYGPDPYGALYGGAYGYGAGAYGAGAYGAGAYGGYGGGAGYGFGLGPVGFGGVSGAYGAYGSHGSKQLTLEVEIKLRPMSYPIDVLVVFTAASNPDTCTVESLGPVLTHPPKDSHGSSYGFGYGASLFDGGYGGGGGGGYGGGYGNVEEEFGVIAKLTLNGGSNAFKIKGLGPFQDLKDLAGRTVALCEDIVVGINGKPVCTGYKFGVLFCAKLGFTIHGQIPILIPPAEHQGYPPSHPIEPPYPPTGKK